MKVLLHFDRSGEVPFGMWWVEDGEPRSKYLNPDSAEAARGRLMMFNRSNPEVAWEVWFDVLADRPPYFEVWASFDSMGFTPDQLLSSLQPSPDTLLA